jgi:hypothetical protein
MAYCRQCGKEVNEGETFCRHCGAKVAAVQPGGGFRGATTRNEEDLAAFVGKNADTYLAKFRAFSENGADSFAATWHWPAFFFSFWWTLYRKMYGWAALVLFLGCIPYIGFLAMIAFGVSANYLYYKHARKKILELSTLPASSMERSAALARAGGVNNVALVIVSIVLIVVIGILAAVAIPSFIQYRSKSCDVQAKHEIQDACSRGLSYFAAHPDKTEIAPEDFLDAGLVRSPDVELMLLDGRRGSFGLSAKHKKGEKIYTTDRQCSLSEDEQSKDTVI